jgi:hypothetical protein
MKRTSDQRVEYAYVSDTSCSPLKGEAMAMFKKYEERIVPYQGTLDIAEIKKFFDTRLTPSSYKFAEGYFSDLTFANGNPTIFIYRPESEADAPYMDIFKKAARENYGKIYWAYSDIFGKL